MTLGEYLVQLLEGHGVEYVFGIPGVHTVELYRGLAGSSIRHVLPRHEQGAGFMADGYARMSGKPGVCLVITGPGLTNIITAMGQAYADSIPMLVISGVNGREDLEHAHGFLHEMPDQQSVVRSVCAFSHRVQSAEELPGILARAFSVFTGSRPRPVHLEIPLDVMAMPVKSAAPAAVSVVTSGGISPEVASDILSRVARAKQPLVLIGGGCRRTSPELLGRALDAIGAPAVLTINGRDCLDSRHPLAIPASPSLEAVRSAMREADLLVVLGSELGRTDYDMFARGMPQITADIVRVDIDVCQLAGSQFAGRDASRDLLIAADVAQVVAELAKHAACPNPDHVWAAQLRSAALANLDVRMRAGVRLLDIMRTWLPEVVIVGDSTQPVYAGNLYHGVSLPGRWFNSSVGFGTLGYALPAAIGAKLAARDQPVVALIGDGGLQFTIGELAALLPDCPIMILVWNNQGYEEIRTSMVSVGVEPVGIDPPCPDLSKIAQAYGLAYAAPESVEALEKLMDFIRQDEKSILIELNESTFYRALSA